MTCSARSSTPSSRETRTTRSAPSTRSTARWPNSRRIFEKYGIGLNLEAHPYDFAELNDDAIGIIRGLNLPWVNYVFCAPHAFHLSDGAGDIRRMMELAGGRLQHLHIADCFNHRANVGNRYIINPPGVDARIHQHNEIGNGDIDWDEFFCTLRDMTSTGWPRSASSAGRRTPTRSTAGCWIG